MKTLVIRAAVAAFATFGLLLSGVATAAEGDLPDPASGEFCQAVQRILANTDMGGTIEVFDNMPDYRASKPAPDPLMIYQVVTYDDKRPVAVSCKVKTADHLIAAYGEDAAGEQQYCPTVTEMVRQQAVRELEAEYPPEAAAAARAFIIDQNEPYLTGREYLQNFELSYRDPEGNIHIQSPGLQTDWESLLCYIMPDRVCGQTYCHLATVSYMKALATGAIEPGLVLTTTDDAVTVPPARQAAAN